MKSHNLGHNSYINSSNKYYYREKNGRKERKKEKSYLLTKDSTIAWRSGLESLVRTTLSVTGTEAALELEYLRHWSIFFSLLRDWLLNFKDWVPAAAILAIRFFPILKSTSTPTTFTSFYFTFHFSDRGTEGFRF